MRSAKVAQSVATGKSVCCSRAASSVSMWRCPFADHLHLVKERIVGSILQSQQLGDNAVFGVHA
jgi:hypothetical protein